MADNSQELDEILAKLARETTLADKSADSATTSAAVKDAGKRYQWSIGEAKQAILDWHNKQVEEVLDRLEAQASFAMYMSVERAFIPMSAIQAERAKLKEVK